MLEFFSAFLSRFFINFKCERFLLSIQLLRAFFINYFNKIFQGTEETVRVVSMDKDFHVDCYVCEDCGMQLTDEPDKRCYPLDGRLMCRSCHIQRISHTQPRAPQPVSATYQYMG